MDTLIVLMLESFRVYLLGVHWDTWIGKCLILMKASNWDVLIVTWKYIHNHTWD